MKKNIITIFIVVFCLQGYSQSVSINEAIIIAENAILERASSANDDLVKHKEFNVNNTASYSYNNKEVFHIINFLPSGFAVISSHKSCYPVLAFSFESSFDIEDMHPAVEWWMNNYATQIENNINNNVNNKFVSEWDRLYTSTESFKINKSIKTTTPLIKTKWDQGIYYNAHCPPDPEGPDGRTVVGCVAVAIGQIMKYFNHPETGTGSYSYYHEDYGQLEVDFSEQSYNYDHMPIRATDYNDDLAKLLFHIGVSVDMDYGPNGSGMWNHKGAFTMYTYFDYHPETQYLFRDSLPEDFDWNGTLVNHIDQKIPLYYAGWTDTLFVRGHAFNLDAYSDSTHFHVNWGWGGSFDGFFYIENLTPGSSDFTLLHEVIINAVPANPSNHCNTFKELTTFEGIIDDGSGPLSFYENNLECSWLINPQDSANGIKFEFLKFILDSNDEVIIFDGPNQDSPILRNFTGADVPDNFHSTSDKVLVMFITDGDSVNDGWLLSYEGVKPKYCNLITVLTDDSGVITDGSNDYQYQNGTFCTWRIEPENAENIKITFLEFDTEPIHDYVQIINENNQAVATFSGSSLPQPIIVEGSKASIVFRSNSSIRAGGFKCHYQTNVGNINEIIGSNPSVYPNPTNEYIYVDLSGLYKLTSIKLFNTLGQKLIYNSINAADIENYKINLDGIERGLYYLQIKDSASTYTVKIIKN